MAMSVFGGAVAGCIDYFIATNRHGASALAIGVVIAGVIALLMRRVLWSRSGQSAPDATTAASIGDAIRRWYFAMLCAALGTALIVYGIAVADTPVAVSGIPFVLLAASLVAAKHFLGGPR